MSAITAAKQECDRCGADVLILDLVCVGRHIWWCTRCATEYPWPSPFAAQFKAEDPS